MLLERGEVKKSADKKDEKLEGKKDKKFEGKFGKRDALTGKYVPKPEKLQNSFGALQNSGDDDDDDEDNCDNIAHMTNCQFVK